jgi:nucleoside-diphosphate-sugar epimerase
MAATEQLLVVGCGDVGMRVAGLWLAAAPAGTRLAWGMRRSPPAAPCHPAGLRWLRGDVRDPSILALLPAGITHVAYLPTPDGRNEADYRATFVDGLRHVWSALDHAALQRFLLVSSSAVYGDHQGAWIDEDTPTNPPGFNGAILREAEQWLSQQPASTVTLRLAGLYGPGRVQLAERLRAGRARVPRTTRHWANRIHVDDAAGAIAHLLHAPQPLQVYIGADDTPLPLDELYDYIATLVGAPPPAEGPPPPGIGSKRLRNTRLRASGYTLRWPDARAGYAALLRQP